MHTRNFPALTVTAIVMLLLLSACSTMHESAASLNWQDQWGDRGKQVLQRDYVMCEALVEQRRSLLASCLAARGWTL